MKQTLMIVGVVLALAGTSGQAAEQKMQPARQAVIFASADKAAFKEVAPGIAKALLWGNDSQGAYGAFTRFKPGTNNGEHTHTSDIWLVVLKGAYLYQDEAGKKRVGPGEFMRIPGGHKHWSGGDAKEGALFYEEASGKFDLLPAK